jgi:hypothetical protein
MYKGYNPDMDISEPKEETVGSYQASYMEIGGKGTHDVAFRFAWYQFLFEGQIVTVQFTGTEYQLKEGLAEFRKVVESLKFQRQIQTHIVTQSRFRHVSGIMGLHLAC